MQNCIPNTIHTRTHITRTTTTYTTTMIIMMMMMMMMMMIITWTTAKVCRSIFSISSHVNWPSTRLRDNVPWCERDMCSAFRRNNPPPVIGLFLSFKYYILIRILQSTGIHAYYFVIKTVFSSITNTCVRDVAKKIFCKAQNVIIIIIIIIIIIVVFVVVVCHMTTADSPVLYFFFLFVLLSPLPKN